MGNLTSRQRGGVEEVDASSGAGYRYPPKSGNYFGCHFIMGGEKFDSPQPESFLFGENSDLNFLGNKPVPFPYPPPQANEPTKTLKSLVNIRRDSLHFVKVKEESAAPVGAGLLEQEAAPPPAGPESKAGSPGSEAVPATPPQEHHRYNIEFTFDCDVRIAITIYYLATEDITLSGVTYTPRDIKLVSQTYHYKKGAGQVFQQPAHVFQPDLFENELWYNPDTEVMPLVIQCAAEEGEEPRQSHATIAVVEKHSDGQYVIKALKQKLFVDGLCYLLQEIYGIENKNADEIIEEDVDDTGAECVVCMSDMRDTLILPCRHLCLCNSCADSLRYQANNCPICRAPFRALLQVRALQKSGNSATHPALAAEAQTDGIPPGYEVVSLVEALNGPLSHSAGAPVVTLGSAEEPTAPSSAADKPKKKSKRRGSREHRSTPASRSGSSQAVTSPPPIEETETSDPLPSPPESPPQAKQKSATIGSRKESTTEVQFVDETEGGDGESSAGREGRRSAARLTGKLKQQQQEVKLGEDTAVREVAAVGGGGGGGSQEGSVHTVDLIEEELKKMTSEQEQKEAEAGGGGKEAGDGQDDICCSLAEEELLDNLAPVEIFNNEEADDEEEDEAEIVSIRSQVAVASLPGTPRSGDSLRSSQESASSVNSSKHLLMDNHSATPKVTRLGKASVAPQEDSTV